MKLVKNDTVMTTEVLSKDFGSVVVYLDDAKNKIGNGYYVTSTKNGKHLAGFVDIQGKEIIPLKEMELDEVFNTPSYHDICFGFRLKDTEILEYYHVKKYDDTNYKVVLKTDPFDQIPVAIRQIKEDSSLWMFETLKGDSEYAIYSVDEVRLLTYFFDEISFDLESNPNHFAYFCKYIYSDIEIDSEIPSRIIHTSICGFFDRKGDFSSQVFETEADLLYNSYNLGSNSLSKSFKVFLSELENKYLNKYNQKEDSVEDVINYLFNNSNLSEVPKTKSSEPTKIIEFKRKD